MPNHIQNRITVTGNEDQVKELLNHIKGKDGDGTEVQIDFNKIKPMPECMGAEVHSVIKMWVEICTGQIDLSILFKPLEDSVSNLLENRKYSDLTKRMAANTAMEHLTGKRETNVKNFSEDEFNTFVQCLKNYREHGSISRYEWSIANWGTKWNAYEQNDKRNQPNVIYFQTAWSSPIDLIGELSGMYPLVCILLEYADEDSGSNTGEILFVNGEALEVNQPESQSIKAYDIYFELHPNDKQNYKLVGNKYEYVEEEN